MYIYDLVEIYKDVMIIASLALVLIYFKRYRREQHENAIAKIRSYSINFCLSDQTNYIEILENSELKFSSTEVYEVFSKFEKISKAVKLMEFDEKIIREFYFQYFMLFYDNYLLDLKASTKVFEEDTIVYPFIEYEKLLKHWMAMSDSFERWGA